jgi:hypothetical protein
MTHDTLFRFEQDFAASLRCIPMAVRFKLDQVGIKLSLRQWARMNSDERLQLLHQPCANAPELETYRSMVEQALGAQSSPVDTLPVEPHPAWMQQDEVPEQVVRYAEGAAVTPPTREQWVALSALQRFVLVKLSRAKHDNINFVPALREFGLLSH